MAHTFANLLYHVVFSTRYRAPCIGEELRDRLYAYMGGVVRAEGGDLLGIGGVPDHVHLLAKFKTSISVAEMVKQIKGVSSSWVNGLRERPERFHWQEGYGIFSVSESSKERVLRYIRNQEAHHRRVSFKDELVTLLKRHGIAYDEKTLLG